MILKMMPTRVSVVLRFSSTTRWCWEAALIRTAHWKMCRLVQSTLVLYTVAQDCKSYIWNCVHNMYKTRTHYILHTFFINHFHGHSVQCLSPTCIKFNAPAHVQLFPVLSVWVLSSWAHRGSCGSLPLGSWDPVQCRSHPAPSKCLPTHCTGHFWTHCTQHYNTALFTIWALYCCALIHWTLYYNTNWTWRTALCTFLMLSV